MSDIIKNSGRTNSEIIGSESGTLKRVNVKTRPDTLVALPIHADALPLPAGAATSALQTQPGVDIGDVTINNTSGASAVNIQDGGNSITVDGTIAATQSGTWTVQPGNTANTTAWKVDGSAVTQPVSAASLPLPTGASTSALQTTGNTSLASIDAGIPAALGQTTMSASMPVTIASNQSSIPVNITSITQGDDETATFSVVARATAIGNNKSMLSLVNTTGSTVKVKLRELYVVNSENTPVTGVVSDFEIRRCVSHSSGTDLTPQSYDTADSLSASVTAKTGATIGTENANIIKHFEWSSDDWGVGGNDVESADHANQVLFNILKQEKGCKPITLRANEGITIKHATNSTAGEFDITFVFTQE